jgi:hypothetical protein
MKRITGLISCALSSAGLFSGSVASFLFILFIAAPVAGVRAQAPAQLSIQGYIEDGGNPVNTPQTIELSLHTAVSGGTQLFLETHPSVAVTDGVYTIPLGSIADLTGVDFNQSLWLQTKVGATTLSPRTRLLGSPSAMTLVVPASVSGEAPDTRVLTVTNTATTGSYGHGITAFGATHGTSAGLYGVSSSTLGTGVVGNATATTGDASGVLGQSASTTGSGVLGYALASTGVTHGVRGEANSTSGRAVYGLATSTTGINYGVYGFSQSTQGTGVFGSAFASSGVNTGVYGRSSSTSGVGARGYAAATTGNTTGVVGETMSSSGTGVLGAASASSGSTIGVYGTVDSPTGFAGAFSGGYGVSISGGPAAAPDLTLRGLSDVDDDGNLYSDVNYSSSDLVLYSNDDIELHLDENEDEGGMFTISNGANTVVFSVDELGAVDINGTVSVNGMLVHASDRNRKEDIAAVDAREILARVVELPIQSWRYRNEPEKHVGPMAQDFYATFGLGRDERGIATVDADGVALAAIQALYELVEAQRATLDAHRLTLERQDLEIRLLKEELARLTRDR